MSTSVLVVDDDLRIRDLLREMLRLFGYSVFEAEDGVDALEKVEETLPDVIITDVMMPNMDGITLCKTLRGQTRTAALPIIMLSGKTHLNASEDGISAGATRYLFKPVAMDNLVKNLREVLEQ